MLDSASAVPACARAVDAGRRLFPEGGAPASFRLTDTRTTTTGVVIATYERA